MKLRDITLKMIQNFIATRNWMGHVELPENDVAWLATELHSWIKGDTRGRCDSCDNPHEIIVLTPLGNICEDCLEGFTEVASEQREAQED